MNTVNVTDAHIVNALREQLSQAMKGQETALAAMLVLHEENVALKKKLAELEAQ